MTTTTIENSGAAVSPEKLVEDVDYLLFGGKLSIQEVCDFVNMTEDELRDIPEINDLFNK